MKTVESVNIEKFMGDWFVQFGRFTFIEDGAYNSLEKYKWNEKEKRIDVTFTFNKDSLQGELKTYTQKAWIFNTKTNAHWKVQPFWPLKLDYLIVDMAQDYSWVAVGVPSEKYLWVMTRSQTISDELRKNIVQRLDQLGYSTKNLVTINHSLN